AAMGRPLVLSSLVALALASPALAPPVGAQARVSLPMRFDADVARALRQFQVPGVALAVVKAGRVLLAEGYGVRRAGAPAPAAPGKSWETFVRERMLAPLGMTETRVGVGDLRPGDPLAAPHGVVDGRPRIVPLDTVDNIAPAGAFLSSVTDLSKWLLVQLDSGRAGRNRLWSARQTRELWSAQTIIPIVDPDPPLAALRPSFAAYGLGWRLRDYRGHKIVWHTGGLAGMASMT